MSEPCPPVPESALEQGMAPCEYLQLSPRQRRRVELRSSPTAYHGPNRYFQKSYSIGGYPMNSHHHMGATPRVYGHQGHHMGSAPRVYGQHMGATPRVYGMSHLGRSVLSTSAAAGFNKKAKAVQPSSAGSYGNTSSNAFIKDLWTAQVLSLWVTDGNAFSDMGMSGIVTRNGHSPSNTAPLGIGADGVATTNLKSLLNGSNTSDLFVKGPDGMFGPSAESVIAEWAGTNKLFGKSLSGNARIALDRLAANITTPKIKAARDAKAAGNPPAPKAGPVKTPCNMLSDVARAARSDCPKTGGTVTPGPKPRPRPRPAPKPTEAAEGGTNWLLYGGIAAAVLAAGGIGWYVYSQNQGSSEI